MKYLKINESLKEIEIPYSIYIISKNIFFIHQEIKNLKKKFQKVLMLFIVHHLKNVIN